MLKKTYFEYDKVTNKSFRKIGSLLDFIRLDKLMIASTTTFATIVYEHARIQKDLSEGVQI